MKKSEFLKRVEFIKDFLSKGFEDYMKEDITGTEFQDLMRLAVKLTPNYCVPFDDEEERSTRKLSIMLLMIAKWKNLMIQKSKCRRSICMNLLITSLTGTVQS